MEITELDLLIKAKETLSCIPIVNQSVEYENINFKINYAIHKRCNHEIVFDNIDTDTERSETIFYCNKCYLTFSIRFFKDYILSTLSENNRSLWKIITNEGIFDLIDVYIKNNMLYFQIWCPGWTNPTSIIKYNLKDLFNCSVDDKFVYINN